jgi:hypothetical protein
MPRTSASTRFLPVAAALLLINLTNFAGILQSAFAGAEFQPEKRDRIDLRPHFSRGQEITLKMELTDREQPDATKTPARKDPKGTKTAKPDPLESTPADDARTGTTRQEIMLRLKVIETGKDGSKLEIIYDAFKISMKHGPLGDIEFDSGRPATKDDPIADMFKAIVGSSIIAEFDRTGNITSVSSGSKGTQATEGLGAAVSNLIRDSFGRVLSIGGAPEFARVGDTWTSDSTMPAPGGTWKIKATNKLRSASGGKAKIEINGKVTLDAATSGAGMGMTVSDSKYTGAAVWDTERGMIESMETKMTASVSHPASMGGGTNKREVGIKVSRVGR